ncbi:MAG: hypothetical protein K9N00_03505 [Candidatus Marinimicrobia bacterium]|nr:hypothetical protein [Candidatus Neomarinimicrobiota bacterium]
MRLKTGILLIILTGLIQAENPDLNISLLQSEQDSVHILPRKAMVMSAIVPGTGQIYARQPLKAVLFAGAEAFCIRQVVYWNRIDNYVEETIDKVGKENWEQLEISQQQDTVQAITGYNLQREPWKPEETRNKSYWWIAGIHIISMLDAYVDAHLINFPEDKLELSSFYTRRRYGINFSIKF